MGWEKILEEKTDPPVFKKWGRGGEAKLKDLKKNEISFENTAIARLQETKKRELHAAE